MDMIYIRLCCQKAAGIAVAVSMLRAISQSASFDGTMQLSHRFSLTPPTSPVLLPMLAATPRQHQLQERPGITPLLPHDLLRRSRGDDLAAAVARARIKSGPCSGADVENLVGSSITRPPLCWSWLFRRSLVQYFTHCVADATWERFRQPSIPVSILRSTLSILLSSGRAAHRLHRIRPVGS